MTNRERIVDWLEAHGPATTPEIYRALRLYQPRVSVLLRQLAAAGCVMLAGRRGRACLWQVVP